MLKFPSEPFHRLFSYEEFLQLNLREYKPLVDLPSLPDFYENREIFITGGTGFVGKALIEKLLRSCPKVGKIFLLLRPSKGKSIEERLKSITENPLFDALRLISPNFEEKLVAIDGDVGKIMLGLSQNSIENLKNVSIVFHSAATVKFDDPLKYAVIINTRGTREVMEFALGLKNLKILCHISTTYSNVYEPVVEEALYPPVADWRKTIEICERFSENELNVFTDHYMSFMPNTYVFSKNLAEHVAKDYSDRLPITMLRPSIVLGSIKEPIPGWVDNFNGPMGILLASASGISKTMYCDPKNVMDTIPVDVCVKVIMIAAWKHAFVRDETFPVYNCASGDKMKLTIKQILDMGISGICEQIPIGKMLFVPSGGVTLCKQYNLVRLFFLQLIPSMMCDAVFSYYGEKFRLMRVQRKMFEANKALSYFVTNNWIFKNDRTFSLTYDLRNEDIRSFGFEETHLTDVTYLIRNALMGFRRFLMKEKDENLEADKIKFKRISNIMKFLKYVFLSLISWFLYYKISAILESYLK